MIFSDDAVETFDVIWKVRATSFEATQQSVAVNTSSSTRFTLRTYDPKMPSPLDQPESSTPNTSQVSDDQPFQPTQPPTKLSIEYDPKKEEEEEETKTLDLGEGNIIKLDKLGPMIVNSDGVSISTGLS